ncbi:hypothetical protein AACA95_03950 [Enterococcus faecalis]
MINLRVISSLSSYISDSSVRFDKEPEIRARLNQTEIETEQSIGLRNVHERLQRFFGESYGLTIEGKEGEGTTIRLSFVA